MLKNILEKQAAREIVSICKIASQRGLLDGWSGNVSSRLSRERIVITAAGTAKGLLKESDCIVIDMAGKILAGNGNPSSESRLHLVLYQEIAGCAAILHSHPGNLQALELAQAESLKNSILNMNLFEAKMWGKRLFMAEPQPPGSLELAKSAFTALVRPISLPCAVWLPNHGLVALAKKLQDALCLSEELEHLASVQLKYLAAVHAKA